RRHTRFSRDWSSDVCSSDLLSREELTEILQRYRQSLNLGVEDLARLIGAAELQAATHHTGPLTAADVMSRDLVTVSPQTRLVQVADIFRRHGFTSLPVVEDDKIGRAHV